MCSLREHMSVRQGRQPVAIASLVVLLLAISLFGSDAHARVLRVRPSDVAATRLYLLAMQKLSRIGGREAQRSEADIHSLITRVSTDCPNIMAGAPATKVVGDLRFQTLSQVSHADGEPTRAAEIEFARTVRRLHWSNRKLDYYVHGSAEEARANAELKTPDVCQEARAIVASDYKTAPAAMVRYEEELDAANSKVVITIIEPSKKSREASEDLPERILAMLHPYLRPGEKKLLPRRPSSAQIERAIKVFFGYVGELVTALGLPTER